MRTRLPFSLLGGNCIGLSIYHFQFVFCVQIIEIICILRRDLCVLHSKRTDIDRREWYHWSLLKKYSWHNLAMAGHVSVHVALLIEAPAAQMTRIWFLLWERIHFWYIVSYLSTQAILAQRNEIQKSRVLGRDRRFSELPVKSDTHIFTDGQSNLCRGLLAPNKCPFNYCDNLKFDPISNTA